MARRLQTVIYDCNPSYRVESVFDGLDLDNEVDRQSMRTPVLLSNQVARTARYRLRPQSTGGYEVNTARYVKQAARGGSLVREWAALELFWSEPTYTTLLVRLHDGDGTSFWWDGAAWAEATLPAEFNTPEDLQGNFSTFPTTGAVSSTVVGLEWSLTTTNKQATPLVYGGLIAARLQFGSRSGDTAAETGSESWLDDSIHRTVLPYLKSALAPEVTDERRLQAGATILDYSDGIGHGIRRYVVNSVSAVYDLDSDPTMLSPLSGSWDSSTLQYTLDSALPAGTDIAVRIQYEPLVAYTADQDLFEDAIPQLVLEQIQQTQDYGSVGDLMVRDIRADPPTALSVPSPSIRVYPIEGVLQSDGIHEAAEFAESIRRVMGNKGGVHLVSGNTGNAVHLFISHRYRPHRRTGTNATALRFAMRITATEYDGDESTVPLLKSGGVNATIGDDDGAVAR